MGQLFPLVMTRSPSWMYFFKTRAIPRSQSVKLVSLLSWLTINWRGARAEETENVVNEAMRIASVEVSIMLVEQDGRIRVNLRSRGHVDVSTIARSFGGGGHARAAGLRSELGLEDLRKRLITAAQDALAN